MQSTVVSVFALVFVVSLGPAQGSPECVPKPGEKLVRGSECCKFVDDFVPSTMIEKVQKCMEKFPAKQPAGPLTKEMKNAMVCTGECVFTEEKLLTPEKKLDTAAINKYFKATDADLEAVVRAAVQKCLKTSGADIDPTLDCKSGAEEFNKCVNREVFLNCPEKTWSTSPECEALKNRASNEKCKNIFLHMRGPAKPSKE